MVDVSVASVSMLALIACLCCCSVCVGGALLDGGMIGQLL